MKIWKTRVLSKTPIFKNITHDSHNENSWSEPKNVVNGDCQALLAKLLSTLMKERIASPLLKKREGSHYHGQKSNPVTHQKK